MGIGEKCCFRCTTSIDRIQQPLLFPLLTAPQALKVINANNNKNCNYQSGQKDGNHSSYFKQREFNKGNSL